MNNFEGMNPIEIQQAMVAMQKQRMEAQPHLKPGIEKANALTPRPEPQTASREAPATPGAPRVESATPRPAPEIRPGVPGARPGLGAEMRAAGASIALGVGVEAMTFGKELVKTVVKEGLGIGRDQRPAIRRAPEQPAPSLLRQDELRKREIRRELTRLTPRYSTPMSRAA